VAVSGDTWDMSKLSTSFNAVSVEGGAAWGGAIAAATFTNVVAGTTLSETGAMTTLSYSLSDGNGSSDSVVFNDAASGTIGTLTLQDVNGNGIGNVSIASTGAANTITTLTDGGLSSLTVSGSKSLTIGAASTSAQTLTITDNSTYAESNAVAVGTAGYNTTLTGAVTVTSLTDASLGTINFAGSAPTVVTGLYVGTAVTHLTIGDTSTGPVQIGTLEADVTPTAAALTNLTFTGSGNIDVGTLTESATSLTIANNGTGTVTVGDSGTSGFTDTSLTSLTLTGQVALGINSLTAATAIGSTAGLTVNAGTDNAHIELTLVGATGTHTDTITVGNGNDFISDGAATATVNVTTGTGYSLVDVHSAGVATLTVGTHTSTATLFDEVKVAALGTNGLSAPNAVITGFGAKDVIYTVDAAGSVATLTSTQLANAAGAATLGAAVAYVDGLASTVANSATAFVFNNNTYVLESAAAGNGTLAAADTLVELVGVHTLTSAAAHVITLAS